MKLRNAFKEVFIKKNSRGQALVEMALSLPILLLLTTSAVDFGNMTYTQHRLSASVYEGLKLVSQSTGNYTLFCPGNTYSTDGSGTSLCTGIQNRFGTALDDSGLEKKQATPFSVKYIGVDKNGETPSSGSAAENLMVEVSVEYPYVHTFGSALGLSVKKLHATASTYVGKLATISNQVCVKHGGPPECYVPE